MATRRLKMRRIKDILKLYLQKFCSYRKIGRALGVSKSSVRNCVSRFELSGLAPEAVEELDDEALEGLLYAAPRAGRERPMPDCAYIQRELRRKGVTLQPLWMEYRAAHPDGLGLTQFCLHYQRFRERLDPVMRQVHKAGEKAFVDWCGDKIPVVDPETGEVREVALFVGVLGASGYTFAWAAESQELRWFVEAHVRMYRFFGGVPAVTVPDNDRIRGDEGGPAEPFEYGEWSRHRVHPDYHVAVAGNHYSVPHALLGKDVKVYLTARMVLVHHEDRRVASHRRLPGKGQTSTEPDHMPSHHREYAQWTPERMRRWAAEVGPKTEELVDRIMAEKAHPELGFRSCMGVLSLVRKCGADRVEKACERALLLRRACYKSVKLILERGLETQPLPDQRPRPAAVLLHENIRGAGHYE